MNNTIKRISARGIETLRHNNRHKRFHSNSYKDVEIPMPWGYISGKWWGNTEQRPILAVHGIEDNCGTFDRLAPLLPRGTSLLCIDLPGHGLSSKLPEGISYDKLNSVMIFRRIQMYFQWPCMSFLAHSLGAMTTFLFASIYPKDVEFFIAIDALSTVSYKDGTLTKEYSEGIDSFLKMERMNLSGKEPPSYTYEEIIKKKPIAPEYCHHLLERGVSRSVNNPDKFYFSRDIRVRNRSFPKFLLSDIKDMASSVTCPILNIKVKGTTYYEKESRAMDVVKVLQKSCKEFKRLEVVGTHHVHLESPETIIDDVNDFITKYYSVLNNKRKTTAVEYDAHENEMLRKKLLNF